MGGWKNKPPTKRGGALRGIEPARVCVIAITTAIIRMRVLVQRRD